MPHAPVARACEVRHRRGMERRTKRITCNARTACSQGCVGADLRAGSGSDAGASWWTSPLEARNDRPVILLSAQGDAHGGAPLAWHTRVTRPSAPPRRVPVDLCHYAADSKKGEVLSVRRGTRRRASLASCGSPGSAPSNADVTSGNPPDDWLERVAGRDCPSLWATSNPPGSISAA